MRPLPGSDDHPSSHLWQSRWDAFLPCSFSLHTTHGNSHFWKDVYCGNKFGRAPNCITSPKFSCASWLAARLLQYLTLLADDLLCELDNLPLCVNFRCYSVRLSFLSCSFLFHEERHKIRRRNRSASLISFLIVWTQIKYLPFFLLLSSAGIEWIKFNLEVLKQMIRMLFSYQALVGVMG